MSKNCLTICAKLLLSCTLIADPTRIYVTSNSGNYSDAGSLGDAILNAVDGCIIDCSPISGQTIYVNNTLPAIGRSYTVPSLSSLTILGSGVTIDGNGPDEGGKPIFSIAQGTDITITDFILQNGASIGGHGGGGNRGGGGGTGGGGALYVHAGTTVTISATSFHSNQAIGGKGGNGTHGVGGGGGGGGGFGGGRGGDASTVGLMSDGASGGGGGNGGGTIGGVALNGGVGISNSFTNFGGAGGGARNASHAGAGGGDASIPATAGGGASGGNAGGGAGAGGSGQSGFASGGHGGAGIGQDYGAGGGGGGARIGGDGLGASGGGGGYFDSSGGHGGAGGILGGGGGGSVDGTGGNGGFGAGGGAGGNGGGIDTYGLGGAGASALMANEGGGGGGGSGLGGAIYVQKGASLILQDGIEFSGNSTTAGTGGTGTYAGADGSSLGEDLFIQAGGAVIFQVNSTLTLPNPIEGGGLLSEATQPGVTLAGSGRVLLQGANTYLGGTLIQSGEYNLNGSVDGDIQIESEGKLSGNATVGGDIQSSGVISPGNSIGTVFTTNLFLGSTNIYPVEVNSSGSSDEIIASGVAHLNGNVMVLPENFNYSAPITYTIIGASGGVTGTFSSLTSSTPALMNLIYQPFSVELTYIPLNFTGNALNAAKCFSTLSPIPGTDAATINNILLSLSIDDVQNAFEQMSPVQFSGLTQVQLLNASLIRSTYFKHLVDFCDKNKKTMNLWIDGVGQWQKQRGYLGYNDTTLGGTLGFDYRINDLVLGLAFSSTRDIFHLTTPESKATINSYYGGIYSLWNVDAFYLNGAILTAWNQFKTERKLQFGSLHRTAHAKHNGNELLANLGFTYRGCTSHFLWAPYINFDYIWQHENSYTESGASSIDLEVNTKNASLLQSEAGISFSKSYTFSKGAFAPMLTLAYINQTPLSSRKYQASYAHSSCIFSGKGLSYERNLFAPRLSLTYKSPHDQTNISLYYDSEIGSQYWAQTIELDFALRF